MVFEIFTKYWLNALAICCGLANIILFSIATTEGKYLLKIFSEILDF